MMTDIALTDTQAPTGLGHLDIGLRKKVRHRLHRVREQRCLTYQQQNDEDCGDHKPTVPNRATVKASALGWQRRWRWCGCAGRCHWHSPMSWCSGKLR